MNKIHFVILTIKGYYNPEFGILLEETDGKRRFFTHCKGKPYEYKEEDIKFIRFMGKFNFELFFN